MPEEFARVPGAVIDERGLAHLGNPLGEQRALAAGTAVAPLADRRAKLRATPLGRKPRRRYSSTG